MIAPPAAAYLLTDRLGVLLLLSAVIAAVSAISGFWMAVWLDASISGSMAATAGISFGLAFLFAPERGWVARLLRKARQRRSFATEMLTIHLLNHEGTPEAAEECKVEHLQEHLRWQPTFADEILKRAARLDLVTETAGLLSLTGAGRALAKTALER
jgi:manganese/zinc/iron transport system permease protein